MKVKHLKTEDLRKMVKEAVATQVKEMKAKKLAESKNASVKKESVKITMSELKKMVNEAVKRRLFENFGEEAPGLGDLVSANGKTGYVEEILPNGKLGVTRDGLKMDVVDAGAVQVLASRAELEEYSPEELADLHLDFDKNADPGEDPQTELDRVSTQLGGNLLSKPTRVGLQNRKRELASKLGHSEMDVMESKNSKKADGGKKINEDRSFGMSFGQFPPEPVWSELVMKHGPLAFRLGDSDYRSLEAAAETIGLSGHEAQSILHSMSDPEEVKTLLTAMVDSMDENASSLASSFMDQLGIEWI